MTDCDRRDDRPRYRPTRVSAYVCFRATEACADELAEVAYNDKTTVSYMARKFVEEGLERRRKRIRREQARGVQGEGT